MYLENGMCSLVKEAMNESNKISEREKYEKAKNFYLSGNYKEAFKIYHELALDGSVGCQRFTGWMYFLGEGVPADIAQALYWFKAAAEAGDPEAEFGVGRVYTRKKDYKSAMAWYEKSASHGFVPSIYRIARMYRYSHGVHTDISKAVHMLRYAAEKGHLRSARDYAVLLIKGYQGLWGRIKGVVLFGKTLIITSILAAKDPNNWRFLN